ncbi:MAG: hypothetical protein P1Q69_12550, partial [Candidatus Thorarchaeota archaeon]|nr:hypothetical protein [Candidatus Thorarchaeota archaeon]
TLEIFEGSQPTSYLEYINFTMYYWDVDTVEGITINTDFTVENETHTLGSGDFIFVHLSNGYYRISVNSSSLSTLGPHKLRITAVWLGGSPFRNNAVRNITTSVIERTTEVEIISPPASTPYLDYVNFTFRYTDTINGLPILVTSDDLDIYANGTLLGVSDFLLNQVGTLFEVSINSTKLSPYLVSSYNITLFVNWDGAVAPYYEDAVTVLKVSTRGRTIFVEVGTIETTPYKDYMLISFYVVDDATGVPIEGAIILFDCQTVSLADSYTLIEGSGLLSGQYNITFNSEFLVSTPDQLGDFDFDLTVQWNQTLQPYYRNRSTIVLTGSVDEIWSNAQANAPQPSSVQITDYVWIIVTYNDLDHDIGIENSNDTIYVSYLATGIIPQELRIEDQGNGVYNISFSTRDLNTFGSHAVNITATLIWHTSSTVIPTFVITEINAVLTPAESEITLYWSEFATITVYYENNLDGNYTPGASVNWTYGTYTGPLSEIDSTGVYTAQIDTSLLDSGTRLVSIVADRDKFLRALTPIILIVLDLPSDMTVITPEEVFTHNRGEEIYVRLYLNDTYNADLINNNYVDDIYIIFNNTRYDMNYNATGLFYYYTLPAEATNPLLPGYVYSARISASINNYDPVSSVFKIDLLATRTFLRLLSESEAQREVFYSDLITFSFNFTTIDNTSIQAGSIFWIYEYIQYDFIHVGGGIWSLTLNSSALGRWGTFGMTFSGVPEDTNLDSSTQSITLTVKQLPTTSPSLQPVFVYWGWQGNITFTYYDTHFERGISNSSGNLDVVVSFIGSTILYDLGNGSFSIFIDTSELAILKYRLGITFDKANYLAASNGVDIIVENVPTELLLDTPLLNWIDDDNSELQVPFGESVLISLFYNDTDSSEGYVGGLPGATNITSITGGIFGVLGEEFVLNDHGNGTYTFLFDSTNEMYFPGTIPASLVGIPYRFVIELQLEYRVSKLISFTIEIIDHPTNFTVFSNFVSDSGDSGTVSMNFGQELTIEFAFTELWAAYLGQGIEGASISVNFFGSQIQLRENRSAGTNDGRYIIVFLADDPFLSLSIGDTRIDIDIVITLANYETGTYELSILLTPTEGQRLTNTVVSWGIPALFVVLLIGFAWMRIFSVPKRLRQINGQIKALSKGKMPKPVAEAKSRRELIAELYNDTNRGLAITRTAEMMPEESIPVAIPEMGELLIQLSILTNLSPEELDEFKADISKMKLSEQAAFVKEVIDQEAIRAARRDGITMDEVILRIEREAREKLSGIEEAATVATGIPAEERIFLTPEETETSYTSEPEVVPEDKVDIAREIRTEEPVSITDKLSDYEIEELRKDLQEKGVAAHEIDTIIEQARELPRDLVEELLKSLDVKGD